MKHHQQEANHLAAGRMVAGYTGVVVHIAVVEPVVVYIAASLPVVGHIAAVELVVLLVAVHTAAAVLLVAAHIEVLQVRLQPLGEQPVGEGVV